MKPRLFIGSSNESLSISYAAQQNLYSDAEITVWTQGVFLPSNTNLESLLNQLNSYDFGIFIFSPDDILFIKEEKNQAVRDNVIFELGLFVGHIGKDRCFILIPNDSDELRIPTDLIGMTPVEYETGRTDDNMQAATGPACHSIRLKIKNLGPRSTLIDSANIEPTLPAQIEENQIIDDKTKTVNKADGSAESEDEWNWLYAYFDKEYDKSATLLEEEISKPANKSDLGYYRSWFASAKYNISPKIGEKIYREVISEYPNNPHPYVRFSSDLMARNLHPAALTILDSGLQKVVNKVRLIKIKAKCLKDMGLKDDGVGLLREAITQFSDDPDAYINLADHYIDSEEYKEARLCLEEGLSIIIDNKPLLETYAKLFYDHLQRKLALIPYNRLLELVPNEPSYLTLRANIYLELELNDLAMRDYKRASEITQQKQAWIVANIGNLEKNRGLYREAIENLRLAIKLDPESQYAHNCLSTTIELRDEEVAKLSKIIKEINEQLLSSKLTSDE